MLQNYILLYFWLSFTTFLDMFFRVSGSGIVNPISAALTDPYRAIGIGYTIFLLGSINKVYLFRKDIFQEKKNIKYLKLMVPVSVAGALLGGLFLTSLNMTVMMWLIILSSVYFIYKTVKSLIENKVEAMSEKMHLGVVAVALFTGFLQGASLPGGDMRGNFLRSHISEVSVRAVSSVIGLFNFLVVSVVLLFSNKLLKSDLLFIVAFVPAMILFQFIAKQVLVKLNDTHAKIIALTMSIVSLVVLVVSFLK